MINRQKLIEELKTEAMDFPHPHAGMNRPYWWNKAINRAINVVESQPPADQWIPCSERLPDEEGYYLVTYDFGHEKVVEKSFFSESHGIFMRCSNITAWMPLPEPYKGVK